MKQIITCPNCMMNGTPQNLAEVLPSGYIAVARQSHKDRGFDYTVVTGNFNLICGNCGTKVLERSENENTSDGIKRIHSLSVMQAVIGSVSLGGKSTAGLTLSEGTVSPVL